MGYLFLLIVGEAVDVLLGKRCTRAQERSILHDLIIDHFRARFAVASGSKPVSSYSLAYQVVNNRLCPLL